MTKEEFEKLKVGDKITILYKDWNVLTFDGEINYQDFDNDDFLFHGDHDILEIWKSQGTMEIRADIGDDNERVIIHYTDAVSYSSRLIINKEIEKSIQNTLMRVYPNTHDFVTTKTEMIAQIHFPKNTISNDHGRQHEILDLYIKLTFFPAGKLKSIEGTRTTCTDIEVKRSYCHSHVSANICNYSSNVCFGSNTEIESSKQELYIGYTEDNFECLLYMLEDFVKHESISGGPYNGGLKNLYHSTTGLSFISIRNLSRIYTYYMNRVPNIDLTFSNTNDLSELNIIDDTKFEESLYQILKDQYPDFVVVKEGKRYLNKENARISDIDYKNLCDRHSGNHITFKGVKIVPNIIRTVETKSIDSNLCMNPKIKNYILSNLTEKINKFYNEQYDKVA